MIKEIPILVSTGLIPPVMTGIKTMTRRTKGLDTINVDPSDWQFEWAEPMRNIWTFTQKSTVNEQTLQDKTFNQVQLKCPYGRPGDILWVRESYKIEGSMSHGQSVLGVLYKAGGYWKQNDSKEVFNLFHSAKSEGWRPSIHLPKIAARIWLKVESIRVERLKDISDSDAIAEGIESYTILDDLIGYKNYSENARKDFLNKSQYQFDNMKEIQSGPVASFCTLWISINGRESWISNPWVWVVSFKVLSTTGKPDLQTT